MLQFFRKYQRVFMTVVVIVIIISFSFFGTYGAMGSSERKKDFAVSRAIDGSNLYYSEIRHLSHLMALQGKEGLFDRVFIQAGAADLLARAYPEALQGEREARFAKAHHSKFYAHPQMPLLNAKTVWAHLAPGLMEEVQQLQKMEAPNADFFARWIQAYSLQQDIAPELVQRVLLYQQRQAGLPSDPRLANADCALFGCRNLEEWFGRNFLDLAAQYVLNGAVLAGQKKLLVSQEEARADYLRQFAGRERELQAMGLSESEGARLWRKALSFSRWLDEMGEAALVDPLPYQKMAEFSHETALVDLYRLPQELCFSNFDELAAFEAYARLACAPPPLALGWPEALLPVEKVAKKAPGLTAAVYRAQVATLDLARLGAMLPMSEVWDWQIEEAHWKQLQKKFSVLKSTENEDGRFALLEKLDPKMRRSVDAWSRKEMVLERPEWIESEFALLKLEEREILVSKEWVDGLEIRSVKPFAELLSRAALQDDSAVEALRSYAEPQTATILRIEGVEEIEGLKVLSFAELKRKGRIPVETFLEGEYRRIRESAPSLFKLESGEWKPLKEVRETALRMIFADLFKSVDKEKSLDWVAHHRFSTLMEKALHAMKASGSLPGGGLWNIEIVERTIERNKNEEWMNQEPFVLQPGQWSPVHVPPNGEIAFFFLKERNVSTEPVLPQIQLGKMTLSCEVKRRFADQLLEIIRLKQALSCPLRIEGEAP